MGFDIQHNSRYMHLDRRTYNYIIDMDAKLKALCNKLILDTKSALQKFSPKNYGVNSLGDSDLQKVRFRQEKGHSNLVSFEYPIITGSPRELHFADFIKTMNAVNKAIDDTVKPLFDKFLKDVQSLGHEIEDSDFGAGVGFLVCDAFPEKALATNFEREQFIAWLAEAGIPVIDGKIPKDCVEQAKNIYVSYLQSYAINPQYTSIFAMP